MKKNLSNETVSKRFEILFDRKKTQIVQKSSDLNALCMWHEINESADEYVYVYSLYNKDTSFLKKS